MPLPLLIPAAIAGGTALANIFAGRSKARAARQAADIGAFAETDAAREARLAANEVNPMLSEAYLRGQHIVSGTANTQADELQRRAQEANQFLDPYTGLGSQAATSLAEFAGPGKTFSAADLEFDPGYQFRLSEGQKALEKSAAARGGLLGGGTAKALTRYGQEAASQEYAAAFDRFQRSQQNRFANLNTLANLGYGAAGRAGENLIGAGQTAGNWRINAAGREADLGTESARLQGSNILNAEQERRNRMVSAAQARAAGIVGSTAATWNGITQGINQGIASGMTMFDLMGGGGGGGGGTPAGQGVYLPRPQYPAWPSTPPYIEPYDYGYSARR